MHYCVPDDGLGVNIVDELCSRISGFILVFIALPCTVVV